MTNEEKAKEFAEIFSGNEVTQKGVQFWLMKIAEWKDQQFISMLSEIFDYFENVVGLYDGGMDSSDVDKPEFIKHFSDRILNPKP